MLFYLLPCSLLPFTYYCRYCFALDAILYSTSKLLGFFFQMQLLPPAKVNANESRINKTPRTDEKPRHTINYVIPTRYNGADYERKKDDARFIPADVKKIP